MFYDNFSALTHRIYFFNTTKQQIFFFSSGVHVRLRGKGCVDPEHRLPLRHNCQGLHPDESTSGEG